MSAYHVQRNSIVSRANAVQETQTRNCACPCLCSRRHAVTSSFSIACDEVISLSLRARMTFFPRCEGISQLDRNLARVTFCHTELFLTA